MLSLNKRRKSVYFTIWSQKISLIKRVNWWTSDTSFTSHWAQDSFSSLRTPQEKGDGSVFISFSPGLHSTPTSGAFGTVFGKFGIEQDPRKVIKQRETSEQILVKGNFTGLEVTLPQRDYLTATLGIVSGRAGRQTQGVWPQSLWSLLTILHFLKYEILKIRRDEILTLETQVSQWGAFLSDIAFLALCTSHFAGIHQFL